MKIKKILAVALAAMLALSFAACGSKTPEEPAEDTTAVVEETAAETVAEDVTEESTAADETQPADEETTAAEAEATEAAETTEEATEAGKKTPQTKAEIIEFYKAAATETDKGTVKGQSKMEMTALNGGDGAAGTLIDLFKPIAESALKNNSSEVDDITGGYEKLVEADVASATAKDDGKYTTIHMTMNQQVDGMNGKSQEGHVGHAISVLPGLQSALDELKGLDLDTTGGNVSLTYKDAYVDVKVDNETGKIVSGTWHFKVDILIENCKAKIGFISAPLYNTTGSVEYTITM